MGTLVNTANIIVGSLLGLVIHKGLAPRFNDMIMKGIALCILVIGIEGSLNSQNMIIVIISIVIGGIIGEALQLDKLLIHLANHLQGIVAKNNPESTFAQGFMSATMLFCIGAMAIVGSLQSGLANDNQMLYTKSILDGITALILASSHGIGVAFSALAVLVYQGTLTLSASFLAPFLSQVTITEMSTVGSVLLIGLGFNLLEMTQLKVTNYIPAIFLPIILIPLGQFLGLL